MIDLIEGRTLIHGLTMEDSILKEETKIEKVIENSVIEKEFESFIEDLKNDEILVLEEPIEIIKKVSNKKKKDISN